MPSRSGIYSLTLLLGGITSTLSRNLTALCNKMSRYSDNDALRRIADAAEEANKLKRIELNLEKCNMLTKSYFDDFVVLITALIQAKSDDDAKIKVLNDKIDATTAADADLNDPALQAKLDDLKKAAAAAALDPNVIPPVVVPPVDTTGAPPVDTTGNP